MMNTINFTRKTIQRMAWFFIVLMINQIFFPAAAMALTSGAAQVEYKTFAPAGSSNMVDLFSGDFNYNIPLLEVPGSDGGYPINLFYNSVLSPDQEASWTGLGWNINVGSLSRTMRGLPDDFNGEAISRKLDMRLDETTTIGVSGSAELAGFDVGSLGLSLGVNYIYNSYKGPGMSIDPMAKIAINKSVSAGGLSFSPNLSLGLSLSTLDAATVNARIGSLGVGPVSASLGIHANARSGIDYSLSLSIPFKIGGRTITRSGTVSFAKNTYVPEVAIPWIGGSFLWDGHFMGGGTYVYGKVGISGSYSFKEVENGGLWQQRAGYGLNYLQNADAHSLRDFNREKDGPLHRHNRYLGNPMLTHDVYSISGQGIGGMFRSHRMDYGILHEPVLISGQGGGSIGFEGGVAFEFGGNGATVFQLDINSPWPIVDNAKYKHSHFNYEPSYYKMVGDITAETPNTYDYIGKNAARDKPLRLKRKGFNIEKVNTAEFEGERDNNGSPISGTYDTKLRLNAEPNYRSKRKKRNVSVQPITNKNLRQINGDEALVEYDVKYYAKSEVNNYGADPTNEIDRPHNDQNGGFTVVGQNGVRWIYGLPVMNHEQKEARFSVAPQTCSKRVGVDMLNGSRDEINYKINQVRSKDYIDEQQVPSYVHTHLLTSVLGDNYGDIDGIPGPSEGDVGYWMKTNYVKLSDNYQWRAPFLGANYVPGFENDVMDDLGLMRWGSRDVYLPATVETKTHIAYFDVSKRYDGRGAKYYIQNISDATAQDAYGEYSYKLDKIRLYSKAEIAAKNGVANATPLKTVHFQYDYSLCKHVENNNPQETDAALLAANTGISELRGKLTLKKVWFTYERNRKGALSPYHFEYSDKNPDYDDNQIDRWGVYRSNFLNPVHNGNACDNVNLPYVNQSPSDKVNQDEDVAAWHLERVTLPSGAILNIELERDDYGYVQDAVANRMFQIESVADSYDNTREQNDDIADDLLFLEEGDYKNRQIKFRLETPIDPTDPKAQEKLEAYIADLPLSVRYGQQFKQVYYKVRMNLRQANHSNALWEYVPGYAEIEKDDNGKEIHFDNPDPNSGLYTHAYITLLGSRIQLASTHQRFNPIVMNGWKFLRDNLPMKFLAVDLGGPPNAVTSLDQLRENIEAVFTGYFNYAYQENFGKELDLSRSFIRLNSPDKVQYGGGARVKKITLEDNWAATSNEVSTLGMAYEYTTEDSEGNLISSGVVQNEPYIGYDECALRWAHLNNELRDQVVRDVFKYEYPINEGYHPGAHVGYSEVKVRSLASNYALDKYKQKPVPNELAQNNFGTTGQTVYEYYTAKDFPIVTSKTSLDDEETNPWATMLIQLISMARVDAYTGTQGYSIELNNMHGQMKRLSTYAQLPDGSMDTQPLKKVEYKYKSKEIADSRRGHNNVKVQVLDNEVEVLATDNPEQAGQLETRLLGVDYDFMVDGRETFKNSGMAGVQMNATYTPPFIVGFFPWPKVDYNETRARTTVANKIIQRTGILEQVDAYDGQAHLTTKNLAFNAQTGAPVLTTVNNQMGGDIYNYSVPAFVAHPRMGAASDNIGLKYDFTFNATPDNCTGYYESSTTSNLPTLVEGDEFIGTFGTSNKYKVIYMGELHNSSGVKAHQFDILNFPAQAQNFSGSLSTVRSGNRNLLGATVAQYSTIDTDGFGSSSNSNPITDRTVGTAWTADMYDIALQGGSAVLNPVGGNTVPYATIDNVLSASAADFSDDWTLEHYNYCSPMSTAGVNPYVSGEKGVWRTKSAYVYIDERTQVGLPVEAKEVDLKKSGLINNVPLFNWKNPFMESCDESKWIRSSDASKYHIGGQMVESRDVLGNYQASLYGYNDNLVKAQGVNTTHYELGYEGFEEPNEVGSLSNLGQSGALNTGHLDFYPSACSQAGKTQHENYRLTFPMKKPSGNKAYILVRKAYNSTLPSNTQAILHVKSDQEQHTIKAAVSAKFDLNVSTNRYKVAGLTHLIDANTQGDYTVYELDFSSCPAAGLNSNDWWAGEVTLLYDVPFQTAHPSVLHDLVTNEQAHTGKYSLKLDNHEARVNQYKHTFHQNTLRLQEGEKYVISAWVKVVNTNPLNIEPFATYADNGKRNITFCGQTFEPTGPIIEGWQRIEGTATYSGNDDIIIQNNTHPDYHQMYVDDIRIFPADGNMVSYVYNPVDYKLQATLDDNNYATFYIYDESGTMVSSRQETERGIVSLQEARSYIKPNGK